VTPAYIPHKKVLTTPDENADELVRLSLGQFISQKALEGEHLVMSVPGHAAFARFAKLPPVEPKKVPDIVKFEAVQQIPFPIEQVEWDYQTFVADDSPEVEVGIFAITRDRVREKLGLYGELNVQPEALTLSPVAVYNAMSFDFNLREHEGPLIFLDIGTQATDVIVVEEGRCWIRTFPLGGTHFTEAIASAFKLSYPKAEKLKREAATSKYARQIMQAMRPVFSDLLQDLQRSIGYYQTAHSDQSLTKMVGLGSTFKIPGLRKFLGQQLQLDVVRLDEFRKIQVTGREAASFAENAVNMATAYGLALQGVGLGAIDVNLVPVKALRDQIWHSKTKWFAAAAAIAVAGSLMLLYRPITDRGALTAGGPGGNVERVIQQGEQYKNEYQEIQSSSGVGFTAVNMQRLLDHRSLWPHIVTDVGRALASTNPQPELLTGGVEELLSVSPEERRLVQLRGLQGAYVPPAEPNASRRIQVSMLVEVSHEEPTVFLNDTVAEWLRSSAEPEGERADVPYRILTETISLNYPALWKTFVVEESGDIAQQEQKSTGGSSGGAGAAGGRFGPPQGPAGPAGGAPGGAAGGGMGPSGGSGMGPASGGQMQRRSQSGRPKRQAPGGNLGGGMAGGPGMSAPGGTGAPAGGSSFGGSRGSSGSQSTERAPTPLEELAPLKDRPTLYPAGTTFYEVPITFTIEVFEPGAAAKPEQTAQAGPAAGGA
jgi:type IV pilus assembly protein PilM